MMRSLLLLALVTCSLTSQAQTLKGKVFTADSEKGHNGKTQYIPLPGATVTWKGTRLGAMTDAHGYFKLPAMNIGDTRCILAWWDSIQQDLLTRDRNMLRFH